MILMGVNNHVYGKDEFHHRISFQNPDRSRAPSAKSRRRLEKRQIQGRPERRLGEPESRGDGPETGETASETGGPEAGETLESAGETVTAEGPEETPAKALEPVRIRFRWWILPLRTSLEIPIPFRIIRERLYF